MPRVAKDVKPAVEMEGISRRQIDEHYDVLYKGYVSKLNEIEAKIPATDKAEANATYCLLRELKKEEVFATDAIRLHELYFENLGGDGQGCSGQIYDLMKDDFGSYEKWEAELKALGVASRGWVILAFDWADRKLHNYITDIHSEAVWGASALLILDVYEHAYFIDYGTARKKYLDAFVKNINWAAVNNRIEHLRLAEARKAQQG